MEFNPPSSDEEIVGAETLSKLDEALSEAGDDLPLEEVRRRLGF